MSLLSPWFYGGSQPPPRKECLLLLLSESETLGRILARGAKGSHRTRTFWNHALHADLVFLLEGHLLVRGDSF